MTDKELLELAAKAAGIELEWASPFVGMGDFVQFTHNKETGDRYDPLTDDGDALRLAVKLKIGIQHSIDGYRIYAAPRDDAPYAESISERIDGYSATRRAIVRAAAEIGRNMNVE